MTSRDDMDYNQLINGILCQVDDLDVFSDEVCHTTEKDIDYDTYLVTLERLISKGFIMNNKAGFNQLEVAVTCGKKEAVQVLLDVAKINPNCPHSLGSTMGHLAAEGGHIEILELLRSQGADLAKDDHVHASVLDAAVGAGQYAMVEHLLNHHMDIIPQRHSNEMVPLDWAIAFGQFNIVKLLLHHGSDPNRTIQDIDPNLPDSWAPTAYYLAFNPVKGDVKVADVVCELIRTGFDIDRLIHLHSGITYPREWSISTTPVLYALAKEKYQTVVAMFCAGARLSCRSGILLPKELSPWYKNVSSLNVLARKQIRKCLPCGYLHDLVKQYQWEIPLGLINYLDFPELKDL